MDLYELIQLWRRRFLAAGVVFIVLLSGFVMIAKYEQSSRVTAAQLTTIKTNLVLMRTATVEMKQALKNYRQLLPPGYEGKTVEALLFDRVDDLKALFPGALLTISAPAELSDGVSIPFSITVSDNNYTGFLNSFAQMQSRSFPFTSMKSVAISYDQAAKGTVVYKLDGTIITPANGKRVGAP